MNKNTIWEMIPLNKKCHWSLTGYLIGDGSWRLHGFALKLGSIMPDILVHTYWTGHKFDTTAARVERNLTALEHSGTWSLMNCFRLGYNLHFLEDYFTYPHNSHFDGGFIAHCWYEHKLSKAMGQFLKRETPKVSLPEAGSSVRAILNRCHAEYMQAVPSPENDVAYIVSATQAVAQELFAAFSRQSISPRSLAFIARTGV